MQPKPKHAQWNPAISEPFRSWEPRWELSIHEILCPQNSWPLRILGHCWSTRTLASDLGILHLQGLPWHFSCIDCIVSIWILKPQDWHFFLGHLQTGRSHLEFQPSASELPSVRLDAATPAWQGMIQTPPRPPATRSRGHRISCRNQLFIWKHMETRFFVRKRSRGSRFWDYPGLCQVTHGSAAHHHHISMEGGCWNLANVRMEQHDVWQVKTPQEKPSHFGKNAHKLNENNIYRLNTNWRHKQKTYNIYRLKSKEFCRTCPSPSAPAALGRNSSRQWARRAQRGTAAPVAFGVPLHPRRIQ